MEGESFSCPEMFKMEYFFIALNHDMFYNNVKYILIGAYYGTKENRTYS